ncbi:MAG: L-seryl-tRNA(Sec) selenium transferase [Candidatus Cloacimonetes bacterium]|nr:L-seryl-tRNA(Sec) selenium transferase [Candidatus Cloacimonadota bacterium]
MKANLELRKLPGVDKLLIYPEIINMIEIYGNELVKYTLRLNLYIVRKEIISEENSYDEIVFFNRVNDTITKIADPSLKQVVNATGIILHTNLGRAPLGEKVLNDITPIILGYSNVEFDLETGGRGHRNSHFKNILKYITNAEDVAVVNNNAAAVLLCLKTLAEGKEVIISRGELIEIGGSFRIPDIMKISGSKMIEVGTTNRTKLSDYENVITDETKIIFKAHKSNYYIGGFTEEVELKELAELAHKHNLILIYDIGSGLLKKPDGINLGNEPDIKTSLYSGVDIITFSGDKLLGGPQAGIIAGKKNLIEQLSNSPLMRTLRVGKLTIAALHSVIRSYLNEVDLIKEIPIFKRFGRNREELLKLAKYFNSELNKMSIRNILIPDTGRTGGGTLPRTEIDSFSIELDFDEFRFGKKMYFELLKFPKPIIGILREGKILFNVYSINKSEVDYIVKNIKILVDKFKH